jgi:hypothetical protein
MGDHVYFNGVYDVLRNKISSAAQTNDWCISFNSSPFGVCWIILVGCSKTIYEQNINIFLFEIIHLINKFSPATAQSLTVSPYMFWPLVVAIITEL